MHFGRLGKRGSAKVLSTGRVEFAPDDLALWAGPLTVIILIWSAAKALMHSHTRPWDFLNPACFGFLALMFLVSFPGTIVVSNDGLEQIYWFAKNKRIKWKEIEEIDVKKNGGSVIVTGVNETKIIHTGELTDRARFLLELKQHCGDNLPPDFPREPIPEL